MSAALADGNRSWLVSSSILNRPGQRSMLKGSVSGSVEIDASFLASK